MPKPKDPCKPFACRIQTCLKENEFKEDRCLDVLEDMRQCCLKWHRESVCCSGILLDKVYKNKETVSNERKQPNSTA